MQGANSEYELHLCPPQLQEGERSPTRTSWKGFVPGGPEPMREKPCLWHAEGKAHVQLLPREQPNRPVGERRGALF